MRTPSDEVFRLIKSMERGEKRQFRRFEGLSPGMARSMPLFDLLDKQNEYDEARVLSQFKGRLYGGQVSAAKHHLQKMLLKSLLLSETRRESDPCLLCSEAGILASRGLYQAAERVYRKALGLAGRGEAFYLCCDILTRMLQLPLKAGEGRRLRAQLRESMDCILNLQDFEALHARQRKGESLSTDAELLQPGAARSTRAELRRQLCLLDLYRGQGDFRACVECCVEALKALDQKPVLRAEMARTYAQLLRNQAVYLIVLNEYDRAEALIRDMEKRRDVREAGLIAPATLLGLRLISAQKQGDREGAFELIRSFEWAMEQPRQSPDAQDMLQFCFLAAYVCLWFGKAREGMRFMHTFLSESRSGGAEGLLLAGRLLNLLLHYDLGNFDLLEHETAHFMRYLRGLEVDQAPAQQLNRFLRRTIRLPEGQRKASFLDFEAELAGKSGPDLTDFGQLDVLCWLRSRIRGCSMSEIRSS